MGICNLSSLTLARVKCFFLISFSFSNPSLFYKELKIVYGFLQVPTPIQPKRKEKRTTNEDNTSLPYWPSIQPSNPELVIVYTFKKLVLKIQLGQYQLLLLITTKNIIRSSSPSRNPRAYLQPFKALSRNLYRPLIGKKSHCRHYYVGFPIGPTLMMK